jgi:hypothetical protein
MGIGKKSGQDTCATYANAIFDNYTHMNSGPSLGSGLFCFQIYGDFSGYSDMALGMSKLFGMDLLRNFNYPIFREILLSSGAAGTFLVFLVSGLFIYSTGE